MLQEILGLLVILFFIGRLSWQYYHDQLPRGQFIFWLLFWLAAGIIVIFIRQLDTIASELGFSSSGIELLLYVAVVVMFYLIFRQRLSIERIERDITIMARHAALRSPHEPKHDESRQ